MGERGIVARQARGERRIARGADADRRDAHQGAVRLAFLLPHAEQAFFGGGADVHRARSEPGAVGVEHLHLVVPADAQDGAREREGHFAVVGRLAGEHAVDAAVGELAHALRGEARDLRRGLELHARTQAVADHLAEHAHCARARGRVFLGTQTDPVLHARLVLQQPQSKRASRRGLRRAGGSR